MALELLGACGGNSKADDGGGGASGSAGLAGAAGLGGATGLSGNAGLGGAAGLAGATGLSGNAGTGDLSGIAEPPLLQRPATLGYDCAATTAMRQLQLDSGYDSSVTSANGSVFFARGEQTAIMGGPSSLVLSPLLPNATLGTAVTLTSSQTASFYDTTVLTTPDGLSILSRRGDTDGYQLMWSAATNAGVMTAAAFPITGIPTGLSGYAAAVADSGLGLVWATPTIAGSELSFIGLGFNGVALGTAKLVTNSAYNIYVGGLVATPTGYLVAYVVQGVDSVLYVQTLDALGNAAAPLELDRNPNGFDPFVSLLARDNDILMAWSVTEGSWENSDLSRTTLLSRLDVDGKRVAQDVRVQPVVPNQENVAPALVTRGTDVGLLWSQGSVIYICAGCMPDNQVQFVLLDGSTLSPRSDVVTLTNPATMGGLVRPHGAWQGDALSVAAAIGYHVSAEGAAGTITCTAR
jgi:hypothetical protein